MTENRYSRFIDAGAVLDDYVNTLRTHGFNNVAELGQARDEALARIAELTPPRDETLREHAEHILESHGLLNPAVDEEAWERVLFTLRANYPHYDHSHHDMVLRGIIDALGYATAAADDAMTEAKHHFVDFGPDELRWLADVVEEFEQLYITTSRMADHDTIPPTWPVAVPFAGLPVRVVCGENCWVLRVGGGDD